MLPNFPFFKPLELSDKADVEAVTGQFLPFSDFNFTSLWIYDIHHTSGLALLNGNVVLRMTSYLSDEVIFSFIGVHEVEATLQQIFEYQASEGFKKEVMLIPSVVIDQLQENHQFLVTEDPDNHDYILSVSEHSTLQGAKFHNRRNLANRFEREYGKDTRSEFFSLKEKLNQEHFLKILKSWKSSRNKSDEDTQKEETYLSRLFFAAPELDIYAVLLSFHDLPIGFSIFEPTFKSYAMIHHQKGDASFRGIFEYTLQITAKHLQEFDCEYINYEQDLGIEGLRRAKELLRPVALLKKYKIIPR